MELGKNLLKSLKKELSFNTGTPYNIWQIVPSTIFISSVNNGVGVISTQEVYLILLFKLPNNIKFKNQSSSIRQKFYKSLSLTFWNMEGYSIFLLNSTITKLSKSTEFFYEMLNFNFALSGTLYLNRIFFCKEDVQGFFYMQLHKIVLRF